MNRFLIAALGLLVAAGCNGQNSKQQNKNMNAIVIFFSHAGDNYSVGDVKVGNTKIVADYISELTGADQFEIKTSKYDGMAYMPLTELAQEEQRKGELPPYGSENTFLR